MQGPRSITDFGQSEGRPMEYCVLPPITGRATRQLSRSDADFGWQGVGPRDVVTGLSPSPASSLDDKGASSGL